MHQQALTALCRKQTESDSEESSQAWLFKHTRSIRSYVVPWDMDYSCSFICLLPLHGMLYAQSSSYPPPEAWHVSSQETQTATHADPSQIQVGHVDIQTDLANGLGHHHITCCTQITTCATLCTRVRERKSKRNVSIHAMRASNSVA